MTRTRTLAFAALAITTTLALAGCGGNAGDGGSGAGGESTRTATAIPTGTPASGPHNQADVTFATGMIPHHAQAIEMSDLVLSKNGIDPDVRSGAQEIKEAQGPEIEQLRGWLAGWGEPVPGATSSHDMGGMNHSTSAPSPHMSGMMSAEDMAALKAADGAAASKLFLEQMIEHHRGAIDMARAELAAGTNPDAKRLANTIIATQQAEINKMTELLAG